MTPESMDREPARRLDRQYHWQRHLYDWTRPPILPGRDRLLRGIEAGLVKSAGLGDALGRARPPAILEVGCGTGRNLLWLSRRHPEWSLYGMDLAESMLGTARRRLRSRKVEIARGDACALAPNRFFSVEGEFDAVFFSYSLSMMGRPELAVHRAVEALAPDGTLHLLDFGACAEWPAIPRALLWKWLRAWHVRPAAAGREWLIASAPLLRVEHAISLRGGYAEMLVARRVASHPTDRRFESGWPGLSTPG